MRKISRLLFFLAGMSCVASLIGGGAWAQEGSGRMMFSGYGELHYNNPSDGIAEFDLHRIVLGFGYQFTDNVSFHAELDFEHAFTEPELEFAYLDFYYREPLSFRAGVVLMPVGPLNETHEPPLFYSVERPYVQKNVIPTTWQEPGAGVTGSAADGAIRYRAFVVSGLDAAGFTAESGIRGGRQKGAEAKAEDFAAVGRLEYSPGVSLTVGASGYFGRAGQGNPALGDASVGIVEADALLKIAGFEARGVAALTMISDADSISTYNGTTVGEQIAGGYAELAYHALRQIRPDSARDLVAFGRFEKFDMHYEVADGFVRDPALDREVWTVGLAFLPIPEIAFKADMEFWKDGVGDRWEQFNLGLGFMY